MDLKQHLIALYAKNSKHSGYQILPGKLASIIGQDEIVVKPRYERERLEYILSKISVTGRDILDIGGNSGFFTFECLERGAKKVHHYEGNKAHSAFVKAASKALGYDKYLDITNDYYSFGKEEKRKYDIVLLLNVLHHLGDDYGDSQLSISTAKEQMAIQLNNMADKTRFLVFQMGFCWKGNRTSGLFENGTKMELINFVEKATRGTWEILNIGIPIKVEDHYVYVDLDDKNNERNDTFGEFLNRPLFIMKSLVYES